MNELDGFQKICSISELKEKVGKRFFVDDVDIAVFRIGNDVFAVSNVCIHQKAAIIYDGYVEDFVVSCPAHGWQFSLRDGKMNFGAKGLDSYEVKIINNDVYVKVFQKKMNW
ncbi:MAG: nitrite reductase (NAD(P)H) small subunit [Melioribacteraceae bacterium]|nr:nitrite reductase (NAD(P)H) small subunit [Melioribacteraceae bacterium]